MQAQEVMGILFEVEVNAHIAHLQTESYAQHMALNELYTGIVDLRDRFAEVYQGCYGIISGYPQISIVEGGDMVTYLKSKTFRFREFRDGLQKSEMQQIMDDIIELVDSTIYKLRFLK